MAGDNINASRKLSHIFQPFFAAAPAEIAQINT